MGFLLPVVNQATPGIAINVPIRVVNFTNIASAQFVVRWDRNVLEYLNFNFLNLPGLDQLDFGVQNTLDSGLIRFAWETPTVSTGTSIVDSTIIFRLKFNVVGSLLTSSSIYLSESFPTFFEVTRVFGDSLVAYNLNQVTIQSGIVAVGYTVGVVDELSGGSAFKVYPNPGNGVLNLSFSTGVVSADIDIWIYDNLGRLVYVESLRGGSSIDQVLSLDCLVGKPPGNYLMRVAAGDRLEQKQIILK